MKKNIVLISINLLFLFIFIAGCNVFTDEEKAQMETPYIDAFFNDPGTSLENYDDSPVSISVLTNVIDRAKVSLDIASMGFNLQAVIDACLRAHYRGVTVRFVGDAEYLAGGASGYIAFLQNSIPVVVGNAPHIMHDKFFIIDDELVFASSANTTTSDFTQNNNSFLLIHSPQVAADFKAEFEQMFEGRFGNIKKFIDNGNTYQVGDTKVEVYFSPQEQGAGRMIEYVLAAQQSIDFSIFAFTKDQVGAAFVQKHYEFLNDPTKRVRGILDRSQVIGNGPYHEVYRLLLHKVNVRQDGNESTSFPGDYQAGGGRLHCKAMVIDAGTDNAKVVIGSFNWSASATIANDEFLLILHGKRIASLFLNYFEQMWKNSKPLSGDFIGSYNGQVDSNGIITPGCVLINEVMWDGWNGISGVADDEFIEIKNLTPYPIDLSYWSFSQGAGIVPNDKDVIFGFSPGAYLKPYQTFFVVDHNTVPFDDYVPQVGYHAYQNPDYVLNLANDPRFPRMNLKNAAFYIRLTDSRGNIIDEAGDGATPFYGGNNGVVNYSMERNSTPGDGKLKVNWHQCTGTQGGTNVRDSFKSKIIATPGEENR